MKHAALESDPEAAALYPDSVPELRPAEPPASFHGGKAAEHLDSPATPPEFGENR
jgi:hypothetical protein